MKTKLAICYLLSAICLSAHAQGTTAFTYQGQLHDGGTNANGTYVMTFKLYDTSSGGNSLGTNTTSPTLANGLFSVNLDFGNVFTGGARWLEITVSNGVAQTLSPRVQLLPAPYALYAAVAATVTNGAIMNAQLAGNAVNTTNIQNGAITTTQIANGAVTNANLAANAVATANIQNGAITTNKIASGQVVKSLNGLTDAVTLSAGQNVTLTPSGNNIQISTQTNSTTSIGIGDWTISTNTYKGISDVLALEQNGNICAVFTSSGQMALTGLLAMQGNTIDDVGLINGHGGILNIGGCINGNFCSPSDKNLKDKFSAIDSRTILDRVVGLPITSWNYKQDEKTRHIGPMAQDFYAAFNVGTDDKHIATVDEDGVALAAIQGLNEKLKDKDAEIQDLKQSVAELKKLVQSIAEKK